MADQQIMIWDTKRPKRDPWLTDQWTLNFLQQKHGQRYQKYGDVAQEPNIVEVKKTVVKPVVVNEIVPKPPEVVVGKVQPIERKVTITKRKTGRPRGSKNK